MYQQTETARDVTPSKGLMASSELKKREKKDDKKAEKGRYEDNSMAHVAPGELIVPEPVLRNNPHLKTAIMRDIAKYGVDPHQFMIDGNPTVNPQTGLPEFGFFSKIWKKVKPIAIAAAGYAVGGPAGAALASGTYTKTQGGSWGDALKSAGMSYVGAKGAEALGSYLSTPTDITAASGYGSSVPAGATDITASIGSSASPGLLSRVGDYATTFGDTISSGISNLTSLGAPTDITAPSGFGSSIPTGAPDITAGIGSASKGLLGKAVSGVAADPLKYANLAMGAARVLPALSTPSVGAPKRDGLTADTRDKDSVTTIGGEKEAPEEAPITASPLDAEGRRLTGSSYRGSRYRSF